MSLEHSPVSYRPVNWRINDFCEAHGMGRTKFYDLVAAGKIKLIKFGNKSLVTDKEAQVSKLPSKTGRFDYVRAGQQ